MTADATAVDAIHKTLELDAPPSRVWAALTDPAQLGAWFPDRVEPKDDGGTTLRLVESGFLSDSDREQNVGSWKHELGELVDYLAA